MKLTVAWFTTSKPKGPAIGISKSVPWNAIAERCLSRREGEKDGPNFVPARFRLEPDGKHVRRLGANVLARSAVAIDCETNKTSGESPPPPNEAAGRVRNAGWAAVVYTSHNHTMAAPRYRIVLPLAEEIDHELPAVEVVAGELGLGVVTDTSKVGANSLFYLPSANPGELARHQTVVIDGAPVDAAWIRAAAGKLLFERQAERDRIAAAAYAQAEARRQARITAGFNTDGLLIEKIRANLDLEQILLNHGYEKRGTAFRHPKSTSGSYGADIKEFGGVARIYSHNATDPLHRDNLPNWCGCVTALDAFDVAVILDYGGNRRSALRELAKRYGDTKNQAQERKAVGRLIFRLIREKASHDDIETAAFAEGARRGLTPAQVCEVAHWVVARATAGKGAG